jgi:hypothetical protein
MLTAFGSMIDHLDWSMDEPLGVVQYVEIASVTAPITDDAMGSRVSGACWIGSGVGSGLGSEVGSGTGAEGTGMEV